MTEKTSDSPARHYCYIIYNDIDGTTYNGYTNNIARRLDQHNGVLRGGARSTRKRAGHWRYLAIVTAEGLDKRTALSLEWHVRYPTNKKPRPRAFSGPKGRLESLPLALQNPKFSAFEFEVYVDEPFVDEGHLSLAELFNKP